MVDTLKRIGILGTEGDKPETSHIVAQWAPFMNPTGNITRRTGMIITHVWDKDRPFAAKFAAQYGVRNIVDRYDGMVGKVDGVIQSGLMGAFWSLELVRPYIEAGIPIYMDRPGAYSLTRIRELTELAARHNCPLMVTNNHENNHIVDLLAAAARDLDPLMGVMADSLSDRERRYFPWHCIHGWYMLYPVLAGKVRRVRTYVAAEAPFSPMSIMDCQNADGSRFTAVLARQASVHRGWVKLLGRAASYEGTVLPPFSYRQRNKRGRAAHADDTGEWNNYLLTDFSLPVITKFEAMIRTRRMPQTAAQIAEKVQVFLAMYKSLVENGAEVELARLPEDWTAPNPFPGYFPDGYFSNSIAP